MCDPVPVVPFLRGVLEDGTVHGDGMVGERGSLRGGIAVLAAGQAGTCAVQVSGMVACTGMEVPPDLATTSFTQVATGRLLACGVTPNGTVECWGRCFFDLCEAPPPGLTGIDLGVSYACGLRADGHIVCWGQLTSQPPDGERGTIFLSF